MPPKSMKNSPSPGESTRDKRTTDALSTNSQDEKPLSTGFLNPNTHLCITAGNIGVLIFLVFSNMNQSPNINPVLQELEKACSHKSKDVIGCIKETLETAHDRKFEPWMTAMEQVFEKSERFKSALQTLKSVHDDMHGSTQFHFSRIQETLESMQIRSKELEAMNSTVLSLKYNMSEIKEELYAVKEQILKVKQQTVPLGHSEIGSFSDNLTLQVKTLSSLRETFKIFQTEINKTLAEQSGFIKKIEISTLPKFRADLDKVTSKVDSLEEIVKQNYTNTDHTLEKHDGQIQKIQGDLQTTGSELNTQISKLTALTEKVGKIKGEVDDTFQNQKGEIQTIKETLVPDIRQEILAVDGKAGAADSLAQKNKDDLRVHKEWASSRQREYEQERKDLQSRQETTVYKQSVSQEFIEEMKSRMVLHDVSFYICVFCVICCVFLITVILKGKGRERAAETRTASIKQPRPRDNTDVFCLKWTRPKENSVCVITFHSETEKQHTGEARSVFESVGAPPPAIHTRVLRRHSDIEDLPGSRVFLLFVDFNERNVILEDPSKGLGDLRVTTVRSLWKFGGDVTVIYCRDQGSRNLDGELFNKELSSVYSQPELAQLRNQQRMLSIFEGFSEEQKQHCRDYINRQLKRS